MNTTPFFSIIIPTYNRADFLPKTLETVFSQEFKSFEVIIIDDGSTDTTEEVILAFQSKYAQLSYHKQPNSERGIARNHGIKKAIGAYITFLDSDDWLYPNYLSQAYQAISETQSPAFLHTAYEIVQPDGKVLKKVNNLKSDNYKILIQGNPFSCMGWFLHREKTQNFHFPEDRIIAGSEDWAFALILVANFGVKISHVITSALVNHDSRSVLNFDEAKLEKRTKSALAFALKDTKTAEIYAPYQKRIISYLDAYISLHLALSKNNKSAFKYLWKTLKANPFFIFEKRFLGILKRVVLNYWS